MTGPDPLPWGDADPAVRAARAEAAQAAQAAQAVPVGADVADGEDERVARAALTRLVEPGDAAFGRAVRVHGAARLLRDLCGPGPLPVELARRDPAGYRVRLGGHDPRADLARIAGLGGAFVAPGDPGWPSQLDDLGDARPLGLWVRGAAPLRLAALRSVAVVGARACTDYGAHVAATLAADLAEAGWTVVSGGAYGVDAAAHRGALVVAGRTVAVLACGIDVNYPRGHERLLARIAEEGTLVTELPPGAHPTRYRFVERNRVIAALTRGTVVVEAALRSGALISARRAARLGRRVMGVPGPIGSPSSAGVHALLREPGSVLVTRAAEVIEEVGLIGDDLAPVLAGPARPGDDLAPETRRILETVPTHDTLSTALIAREAGVAPAATRRHLDVLAGRELVDRTSKGWRRRGGA
ncbi:DNA-processing protein DprA [Embleya sp. NPDC050154]|uniref:DNA-processing protein DprA n=1 Tax=Embleya sp. NPDC050154 TaxID=3363988 RepID=UPI0037A0993D